MKNCKFIQTKYVYIFTLCLVLAAAACTRRPQSTAEVPRLISPTYKISVSPFSQTVNPGQLLIGQIPKKQVKIPHDALLALDMELRQVLLSDTKRQYDFIIRQNLPEDLASSHSTGQASALPRWIAYGKKHGAQLLLVPQVLDWHEREGSEAGVTSSAHVRVEFFLLNIDNESLGPRSVFEEKQVGLTENLLTVGEFFKRKGQWVSARQLSVDGMRKAVKELGL